MNVGCCFSGVVFSNVGSWVTGYSVSAVAFTAMELHWLLHMDGGLAVVEDAPTVAGDIGEGGCVTGYWWPSGGYQAHLLTQTVN